MLTRINELDQYISANLQKIEYDDAIFHQLAAPHSGFSTLSYQTYPTTSNSNYEPIKTTKIYFLHEIKAQTETEGGIYSILAKTKINTEAPNNNQWYTFTGNLNKFIDLYNQTDLQIEATFCSPNFTTLSAHTWSSLHGYDEVTHSNYAIIRKKIAEQAVLLINNLNLQDESKEILLLDIGTGTGESLDVCFQELSKQHAKLNIQAVGIDFDQDNISAAKKRYSHYQFMQADLKDLEKIVQSFNPQKNKIVIITSSGSLTRKVLNNTVEALHVFQQAYRSGVFIGSGVNPVLINKKIARKMGWKVTLIKNYNIFSGIYSLEKTSQVIFKIKEGTLNLSLHANPLEMIEKILNPKDIINLDLGLAYLTVEEMRIIISKLPNLKQVFLSGEEINANELISAIKAANIQVTVNRSAYINDIFEVIPQKIKEDLSLRSVNKELKLFSQKTLGKFLFIQNTRSLLDLIKIITSQRNIYGELVMGNFSFPEKMINEETVHAVIEDLTKRSKEGDDAATYRLAIIFENGINVKKIHKKYAVAKVYENLKQSLVYWKILFEKKYPVSDSIARVTHSLEQKKNNFDMLREKADENNNNSFVSKSEENPSEPTSLQELASTLPDNLNTGSFSNNASDDENDNNKDYRSTSYSLSQNKP